MPANSTPVSQRETYNPSAWTRFLWWLSTAEKELLADCVVDRNRYAIVGMTVLGTWAFATLAWTYFFTTVSSSLLAAVALGLFMGGIVLTIDRSLIKGINRTNKTRLIPLLFRGVLAMTIGLFMAQPALLYLFDKEIHVQVSIDNEQRKKQKLQQQDSVYYTARTALQQKKNALQLQLAARYSEVAASRDAFIRETDGTGGSGKVGLKDIARAKESEYRKLDAAYQATEATLRPQIQSTDSALAAIDLTIQQEQKAFDTLLNDGFITRIEALNHLVKDNASVAFRYYLLVAIFLLVELMPVISKMLLPSGSYEEKTILKEQSEKELAGNNDRRELALKENYNQTAFEQDIQFIKEFFAAAESERRAKMQEKFQSWKESPTTSFDSVWEEMKKEVLSKREN
ncbi:DUF4407 domain-containing protein [Sediminibacterium soli]|uniref:DUF4407 domain-containing protein n=1 Tax=Sediminibacterium soli TaxID=2698829 RepID=UPI00137B5EF3|nr:DUF4407 domain-containing protein [Sediminibacterium soli]NCI47931.1 DUF4407 domain-containing protein [Sediminibacterium soli]